MLLHGTVAKITSIGGNNIHSRIFQIEIVPVDENTRITEDHYIVDQWFVYNVADYVCADDDRAGSLEWLKKTLAPAAAFIDYFTDDSGNEGFVLHEGFHAAFFCCGVPGLPAESSGAIGGRFTRNICVR